MTRLLGRGQIAVLPHCWHCRIGLRPRLTAQAGMGSTSGGLKWRAHGWLRQLGAPPGAAQTVKFVHRLRPENATIPALLMMTVPEVLVLIGFASEMTHRVARAPTSP